jgi:hypothetical protein
VNDIFEITSMLGLILSVNKTSGEIIIFDGVSWHKLGKLLVACLLVIKNSID